MDTCIFAHCDKSISLAHSTIRPTTNTLFLCFKMIFTVVSIFHISKLDPDGTIVTIKRNTHEDLNNNKIQKQLNNKKKKKKKKKKEQVTIKQKTTTNKQKIKQNKTTQQNKKTNNKQTNKQKKERNKTTTQHNTTQHTHAHTHKMWWFGGLEIQTWKVFRWKVFSWVYLNKLTCCWDMILQMKEYTMERHSFLML